MTKSDIALDLALKLIDNKNFLFYDAINEDPLDRTKRLSENVALMYNTILENIKVD